MKPAASPGPLMRSIGALLASERERRGIAVEKAAKETRMRPARIRDMEADDLSHFTNPSYARMFIIAYAKYLEIPMQTIREHLPDRGEPGSEGHSYINTAPDELPSLRRDLVSRPMRRGWMPTIIVAALVALLLAVLAGGAYLIVNLPRLAESGTARAAAPNDPVIVEKTIILEQPNLTNLPAASPKPVDPIAPSALAPPTASTPPATFTEGANIASPPKPVPVVVLGEGPAASPATLQTAVPTASPSDDDRAFLINSQSDQKIPAN